jgi:hypothetical protein
MKDQEALVKPNVRSAGDAEGFLTEMKVQFKEMFTEGMDHLEESMASSHDNLRGELSERITIAATEQHLMMTSLNKQLQAVVSRQDKMDVKMLRRESAGMGIHRVDEVEFSFSAQAQQRQWEEELNPDSFILSCFSEPVESEEARVAMERSQALSTLTVKVAMGRKVPVYDRGETVMRIFDVQMLYTDVMDQYLVITTMEEQQQQMEEGR